jgi:60 kDa SS-A/Ro ribonucleoprotein
LTYAVKGGEAVGAEPPDDEAMKVLWAHERAKKSEAMNEIVRLIADFRLPRECVPTKWLNEASVWEALLESMPPTAMIRNLAKMTAVGLLSPLSDAARKVSEKLSSVEALKKARVHPLSILLALKVYQQGKGDRGSLSWTPLQNVCDALDRAFYLAFQAVEPTNKRWLLALDVSGSMGDSMIAGMTGMSARIASVAMALVTANTENHHQVMKFDTGFQELAISPRQRLDDAIRVASHWNGGGTDCSLPMIYAMERKIPVDCFVVYTDSETFAGIVHPSQALRIYRDRMGIPAKLVVCGMVSNGFTLADPADSGMLDVAGFDTAVPQLMRSFVVGDESTAA